MTRLVTILRSACRPEIASSALKVSLVVGAALNLVNQWDAVVGDGSVAWGRGALNFLVPYCVSSYSAALNATRQCTRNKP